MGCRMHSSLRTYLGSQMRLQVLILLFGSLMTAVVSAAAMARAADLDLPAQSLSESLISLGNRTKMNVLFQPESVQGLTAPAVSGASSVEEALSRLLAGT